MPKKTLDAKLTIRMSQEEKDHLGDSPNAYVRDLIAKDILSRSMTDPLIALPDAGLSLDIPGTSTTLKIIRVEQ